jgi:ABC-type nitrate/sulfonate/bicarbonate transport system ATPase subunit
VSGEVAPTSRSAVAGGAAPPAAASGGTPSVVEFRDVTKIFAAGTPRAYKAIENLSFSIEDLPGTGELISVLGPSGCGKSTMLNLIAGFPEVWPPTSGEVLVRGRPVEGPGRDRGMIFQRYSSFPHQTALENVTFGLELNGHELASSRAERIDLAMHWLGRVGLTQHAGKYPHQLSGGQQQRVAIARTLVLKPKIILMDEPFSALDEPTRLDMQALILALWEEIEATVIIVTHSVAEAVYLGDRVWVFTRAPGRIGRELAAEIPRTRGMTPFEAQSRPEFQHAVDAVTQEFQRITAERAPG